MKKRQPYLKAKSVFIVSLLVIVITILIVYLTGLNYERTVESNSYLSLSIIGIVLFFFMTYGLYNGFDLINNYPIFKGYRRGVLVEATSPIPDMPSVDIGNGVGGIIASILIWIGMSILFVVLLLVIEAIFWFSLFVLIAMLYWVFFRALKLVFNKSSHTKGNLTLSAFYSFAYTFLYLSWIYATVFISEGLT